MILILSASQLTSGQIKIFRTTVFAQTLQDFLGPIGLPQACLKFFIFRPFQNFAGPWEPRELLTYRE